MKRISLVLAVMSLAACSEKQPAAAPAKVQRSALTVSFASGSLIIPMDTTSQDMGTIRAFGLVDRLLRVSTPVNRIIKPAKAHQDIDFTATVTNRRTGAALGAVNYRSSPFVVAAADATTEVLAIVDAYLTANPTVVVHVATASFDADVARKLVASPRISALRTGNQSIIYGYLNAANMLDAAGNPWSDTSLGALTLNQLAGPTAGDDGALMSGGLPAYDQFTVVHYQPTGGDPSLDEMTRELRRWLSSSATTHAHLQCSSTLQFENNVNGRFLSNLGIADVGGASDPVEVLQPESLYAQYSGTLQIDPGDTKSFALNTGSTLWDNASLLVQLQSSTFGQRMNWLTGYVDGATTKGKISYLGGHSYSTNLPISSNARTNGVRLFLNGLFETPALFSDMQPVLTLTKSAPALTKLDTITFTINYANAGPGVAYAASLTDALPTGTTFSSATGGGTYNGTAVVWTLGNLAPGAAGSVTLTVNALTDGTYQNRAVLAYRVGVTPKTFNSTLTTTVVDRTPPVTSFSSTPVDPTRFATGSFAFAANETASYQCSLDTAAFVACTAPWALSGLVEGPHTFDVKATDTAGNAELTPASFTWTVDLTGPVVTFNSPPAVPAANTSVTSATFNFTVSGASLVECDLDGVFTSPCPSPKTYAGPLLDGPHTFTVRATDAAGNVTTLPFEWTVDTVSPSLAFTAKPGNPTNQTDANFIFTVSGASTVQCRLDSLGVTGTFAACGSPQGYPGLTNGNYTFTVQATDLANNVATITHNWTINTVAPAVTITGPTSPTQLRTAQLTFTVNSVAAIVNVQCQLNGVAFTPCNSPVNLSSLADGSYNFTVTATDAANNVGSNNHLWVVDTVAPVITFPVPPLNPSNPSNQPSGEIAFSVSEPATLECEHDALGFGPCTTASTYGYASLLEDSHTVTVRATDGAGNVGTNSFTWLVDLTRPVLSFDLNGTPVSRSNQDSATFRFTVSGASNVQCQLENTGAFVDCTSPWPVSSLGQGSHTFTVKATDAATNVTTIDHTWEVDTVAPVVTFDTTPPLLSPLATANFTFTVTGATLVECKQDSAAYTTPCISPVGLAGLADGLHTYTVRASDDATNTTSRTYSWTVDTTPPDITFNNPPGLTNLTTATLDFVVTGDPNTIECRLDRPGIPGNFATCSASPPTLLTGLVANGLYTFTVRATDLAGNPQSRSASWTVDTVAPALAFTSKPGNPTNQTTADFTFTLSDGIVQCRLDSPAPVGAGSFVACPALEASYPGLIDGSYTFTVSAVDAAGNVGTLVYDWVVNTIAPTVTITQGPTNPTQATTADFTFTTTGVSTVCEVSFVSPLGVPSIINPFASCTSPHAVTGPLADGSYTFTVRATDAASNVGSANYLWVVDTTAPVVTFPAPPPLLSGTAGASVAFTVNETASTECALNGGTAVPCSSPYVLSNLGEGAQSLVVSATDPAGNVGTRTVTWSVDTLAPVITFTSTPAALINVDNATLVFTVSETATLECQLNAGTFAACSSPHVLTALADGSYALTIRATDATGNEGFASHAWAVDTTLPVVTFTSTPPTLSGTDAATLAFNVSEAATIECALNGGAFVACTSPHVLTSLGEGAQTLVVRATDPSGNVGTQSASWTVDTVDPVISFTSTPATLVNLTDASFAFTVNETATLECQLDSGAFVSCSSPRALTALADGSHTLTVRATDATNNVGTASFTWVVDTVPPVVTLTATPPAIANVTTASFEFTVTGNAAAIECQLDTGAFAACTSPHPLFGLSDGNHTFTVRATDAATNAASASSTWRVDAQLPDTTIASGPASVVNSASANVDFTASETATFECSLDGAVFSACSDPLALTSLADGLHVLLARAVDVAGNRDLTPARTSWTVDTLAPDAPRFLEPVAGATTGAFPRLGGVSEPGSTITVSNGGQTVCTAVVAADGSWSCTGTTAFTSGQQTLTATATDPAGNVSQPSLPRTFTVDASVPDTTLLTGPSGLVASTQADFTVAASQTGATFECSLDGAAFTTCSAAPSFTGLAQGAHHLEVRAVLGAVRDGSPDTRDWTVDTVAPAAPVFLAPASSAITSATPVFSGTAEPGSTVVVSLDGQPACTAVADAAGAFSCAAPSALSVGSHSVTAIASDVVGNASAPSAAVPFTVDGALLDTAIIAGPRGQVSSRTADFAFTATVLGATFECSLDGATFAACVTPTSFLNLTDGDHTLEVRAVDGATTDSSPASRTWNVDATAPAAPVIVAPANNATVYTRTPAYSGTAAPLSTVRVSVDDRTVCTAVADAAGAWSCTSPTELASGEHHVAAVALDAAGNVSPSSMVSVFTVEIPMVTVTITSPVTNTLTNDATPTFSGTTTPNATVTVFVDGVQVGTTTANAMGRWTFTPGTALTDGARVVTAQAEFMGYQSPRSVAVTVRIDTRPPVVNLTITQADENTVPTVTFTADESPVTFTCSLDQGTFEPCTSPLDVTALGDGNHTVVVRATDEAGNVGSATRNYVVVAPLIAQPDKVFIRGGGCGCGATDGSSLLAGLALLVLASSSRRRVRRAAAPALLGLTLVAGSASAQVSGFDLERLDLNTGASASLINQTGDVMKQGSWRASITAHYQHDSLLLHRQGTNERLGAIVGSRFTTHLAGAWAPLDWLELGLQLPIVLWQGGDDLSAFDVAKPVSTALGTPWVTGRFGLLRQRAGSPVDLSLQLGLGLPIGLAAAYSNSPPLSFAPRLGVGRTLLPWLRAGGEVGVLVRGAPPANDAPNVSQPGAASSFTYGLSLTTLGDGLRGELSWRGGLGLDAGQGGGELLLGARYPLGRLFELYAIGGPGFGSLPGTPAFRVMLGLALQPPLEAPTPKCDASVSVEALRRDCGALDADGDTLTNAADSCPRVPGVAKRQGCPVPDTDGDGLDDELDRCPTEKGTKERNGCPVRDADADGVEDDVDACPKEAGPADHKGCPVRDQDQDGVEDDVDACPTEAGPTERKGCPVRDQDQDTVEDAVDNCPTEKGVPENAGCPAKKRQLVIITADKLQILEKVYFATGKNQVLAKSFPLLDNVANVLVSHPELQIRIEGHTDSTGVREKNVTLSQGRADAVKAYLVKQKVAAERLEAVGFGPDKPTATNDTPEGREQNRRVEFNLAPKE